MPELPEVETVRRGLAPAMAAPASQRRSAPARPALSLAGGLRRSGRGPAVEALGRRAKYLLVDLDGGDVLVMHLGMSGSFRVEAGGDAARRRASSTTPRSQARGPRPRGVPHCRTGATVTFNDPRRFGFMDLVAARGARGASAAARASAPSRSATNSTPRCWRGLAGRKTSAQGGAARPDAWSPGSATSMSARRCTARACRPSAAPRPSRPATAPNARAERAGRRHPRGARRRDRGRRIDAARPPPDRRRARLFPASFPRLRPRGRALPDAGLQGHGQAHRAGGRSTFFCPVCQK